VALALTRKHQIKMGPVYAEVLCGPAQARPTDNPAALGALFPLRAPNVSPYHASRLADAVNAVNWKVNCMAATLSARIKELRLSAGLSGERFGQLIGVTKAYISQLEHGTRLKLDPQKVVILSSKLGVNPKWLTGEDDRREPPDKTQTVAKVLADPRAPYEVAGSESKKAKVSELRRELDALRAVVQRLDQVCTRLERDAE
jgi:transcriptional regulator with XRE-family HTH domain